MQASLPVNLHTGKTRSRNRRADIRDKNIGADLVKATSVAKPKIARSDMPDLICENNL